MATSSGRATSAPATSSRTRAFLAAMVDVEAGLARRPGRRRRRARAAAAPDLHALVTPDLTSAAWPSDAEAGGNPAMALVAAAARRPAGRRARRRRVAAPRPDQPGRGRHRADALRPRRRRRAPGRARATRSAGSPASSRSTGPRRWSARTLTQHAVPTTFGLKAAGWLTGVLDAYDDLAALVLPVQVGGAAGTMAGTVELAAGLPDPVEVAHQLSVELADAPRPRAVARPGTRRAPP